MDETRTYSYLFTLSDLLLLIAGGFIVSKVILAILAPPLGPPPITRTEIRTSDSANVQVLDADAAVILRRNLFGSKILSSSPAVTEKS